jgi:DNA-binding phage protein
MVKTKIFKKQKISLKKSKSITLLPHDPYVKDLAEKERIREAVYHSLVEGDLEAVQDLLIAHLATLNKLKLVNEKKIGRQTLYDLMNRERDFNPTLKTIVTILAA